MTAPGSANARTGWQMIRVTSMETAGTAPEILRRDRAPWTAQPLTISIATVARDVKVHSVRAIRAASAIRAVPVPIPAVIAVADCRAAAAVFAEEVAAGANQLTNESVACRPAAIRLTAPAARHVNLLQR